jgi:hypothetical protein
MLLVGLPSVGTAGAQVGPSRSLSAVPKPGKSCPAKKLGKKAKEGKLTLVCKKVHSHDQWVVSKTAVKTKTLSVAQVKKSFAADVAPADSALTKAMAEAEAYGTSITPTEAAAISAPLIAACQKLDTQLSALHATGAIETDIRSYVAEDSVIVTLLQSVGSQTSLTLVSWYETLRHDGSLLKADGAVLRAALGLPPAS